MARLSDKQQKFIDYYIETGNATEATKRAGYQAKSEKAYQNIGSENLGKLGDQIQERLDEIASGRIAGAKEVLEYLTAVMRREHKETVVVTLKKETSKYEPGEDGKLRKQTIKEEVPELVQIPAKLSDANKAAELLGKRYALFTEKVDVSGDVGVKIIDDIGDDSDG